jgi:hypothetical protein
MQVVAAGKCNFSFFFHGLQGLLEKPPLIIDFPVIHLHLQGFGFPLIYPYPVLVG